MKNHQLTKKSLKNAADGSITQLKQIEKKLNLAHKTCGNRSFQDAANIISEYITLQDQLDKGQYLTPSN